MYLYKRIHAVMDKAKRRMREAVARGEEELAVREQEVMLEREAKLAALRQVLRLCVLHKRNLYVMKRGLLVIKKTLM